MRKLCALSALTILFFLTSCAPKVYTSLQKSYPARNPQSTVLVYDLEETIPQPAETLGRVTVKDTGFSTHCDYQQVIQLAKNETNKAGGNGLKIDWHGTPGLASTCHRIRGTILRLPDSLYYKDYMPAAAAQTLSETTAAHTPMYVKQPKTSPVLTERSTLFLQAGYGIVTSKLFLPDGSTGHPDKGVTFDAGYHWISKIGIGAGLRYAGYYSTFDLSGKKCNINLHFAGPEFVYRWDFARKWLLRLSLGIGYARYSEATTLESGGYNGWGAVADMGIEYRVSPHIGLGAGLSACTTRFKGMDAYVRDKDLRGGIEYIQFKGGVQFYF